MSSKRKNRPEWTQCDTCNSWSPAGPAPCQYCTGLQLDSVKEQGRTLIKDIDTKPYSGSIRDNVLTGVVQLYTETHQPRNGIGNVVYLQPSTISIMKLYAGASVIIRSGVNKTMCICWPGKPARVDSIMLSNSKILTLNAEIGDTVELSSFLGTSLTADSVIVETEKCTNFDTKNMEESLCCYLDGCDILIGELLEVKFLGNPFCFKVIDILSNMDLKRQNSSATKESKGDISFMKKNLDGLVQNNLNNSLEMITNNFDSMQLEEIPGSDKASPLSQVQSYHVSYPESKFIVQAKSQIQAPKEVIQSVMLGGYEEQLRAVRESVHIALKAHQFLRNKMQFLSFGLLLHGPPGTGKTLLAKTVIKESNVHCINVFGPEIVSKFYGETESKLKQLFQSAFDKSPSIVFIDELDALCPKRDDMNNETEKRVVSTLLTLMDSLGERAYSNPVIVMAATNRIEAVEPALRRPGRFDKEIEIGVPNSIDRAAILQVMIQEVAHGLTRQDVSAIASAAHGFVGADLLAVVREAFHMALKRATGERSLFHIPNNEVSEITKNLSLLKSDFMEALQKVRPSALRALTVDVPQVYWSDVGGQEKIKQMLREAVEWPLKHEDAFKRLGISPPCGVLLYGPPGCSKTLLAKALATESGLNFISVKGPELFSKFLGESEKAVRVLFQKARTAAPSIIFFDELDAMGTQRNNGEGGSVGERVLAQMLTEMDGIEGLEGVLVVAATNRPDLIDTALLRPGRIDRIIYVPLPDKETRAEIFKIQFRTMPVAKDVDLNILVEMSENYSGAEICALCKEAAIVALRENLEANEVAQSHFDDVMYLFKPRTKSEQLRFYETFSLGI